jgi:hypothetical protein
MVSVEVPVAREPLDPIVPVRIAPVPPPEPDTENVTVEPGVYPEPPAVTLVALIAPADCVAVTVIPLPEEVSG